MHMANEQYQQNSHKWNTWQLGFQTLERYWASFSLFFFFFLVGGAQLQCIYYLVLYTDLKTTEGN